MNNQPRMSIDDILQEGAIKYEKGEFSIALQLFTEAKTEATENENAFLWTSAVCRSIGRLQACLDNCDLALQINPASSQTYDYKATCMIDMGRFSEALTITDEALKYEEDDMDAYDLKGIALRWLGRPQEALVAFNKAVELDPTAEYVRIHRCTTIHDCGHTMEALATLEKLQSHGPCLVLCLTSRAIILRELRQPQQAEMLLSEARNYNKIAFRQFTLAFGQRLYYCHNFKEALFYFTQYLHPDLNDACHLQKANVYYYSALALAALSRGREAISYLNTAASLDNELETTCLALKEQICCSIQGEKMLHCDAYHDISFVIK
jgi:tetratricopeptide (TPR) repeat protein